MSTTPAQPVLPALENAPSVSASKRPPARSG